MKSLFLSFAMPIFLIGIASPHVCMAKRYSDEDSSTMVRETRDSVYDLRNDISNYETQLHTLQAKSESLDEAVESLRQQVIESRKTNKESLKGSTASLESKIVNLESDARLLKASLNETITAVTLNDAKIKQLERSIELISQNIVNLEAATKAILTAIGKESPAEKKSVAPSSSAAKSNVPNGYTVKEGDSLGSIAQANKTTIKALKERNQLKSDKIVVGQVLVIP
jgi:LysM repeat protein